MCTPDPWSPCAHLILSLRGGWTGTKDYTFHALSAVNSGVNEIKQAVAQAEASRALGQPRTVLFLDEIHRLNKLQQV